MSWINTLKIGQPRVSGFAVALVTILSAAHMCAAQVLQKGISVELASTSSAVTVPDADNENAWIVTVTDNGGLYLGIDAITPAALAERVKNRLPNREQRVYIKADARAPYAFVVKVLDAVRTAGVEAPILLTTQPGSPEPGKIVPPKGLEVLVGPRLSRSVSTVVEVLNSGQQWPTVRVNGAAVPWASLQSALRQALQNQSDKEVVVQADALLPFAQVVHVIDICRSMRANVVLVTPLRTIRSLQERREL
jgi:biopolymer transport protein ExbD